MDCLWQYWKLRIWSVSAGPEINHWKLITCIYNQNVHKFSTPKKLHVLVEIKPNLQGYSCRSSSHHYLFATCMFHCMVPKLIPHDGLQDTSMNKDCIECIVLFFNREFDLPWEVDASKGPARSSRPGRSRWFSEDPSALLYSNIASIVFMVLLYAWVLQYSLYCIAVDALFFFCTATYSQNFQ